MEVEERCSSLWDLKVVICGCLGFEGVVGVAYVGHVPVCPIFHGVGEGGTGRDGMGFDLVSEYDWMGKGGVWSRYP